MHVSTPWPETVDGFARAALVRELELEGKPGLVSPRSNGSHHDMQAAHFRASIAALGGYFGECARLGAARAPFAALQAAGRAAELAMWAATGGINTHKGAVFTLGLVCAALGAHPRHAAEPDRLGETIAHTWGAAIATAGLAAPDSNGRRVAAKLGLPGAREQAVAGLPVLFELTLPNLRRARARGLPADDAALEALIATIAVLPDTNLAHRGGLPGLHWAQAAAAEFMRAGGMATPDARQRLDELGRGFVARRLSPGGAADLLAAACLVDAAAADVRAARAHTEAWRA